MIATIGFIGLGQLGAPIADNLLGAGYAVRVHNCFASKANAGMPGIFRLVQR